MKVIKNILFAAVTFFAGVAFSQNANTDSSSGQLETYESEKNNGEQNSDSYKSGKSGSQKKPRRGSGGPNSLNKKAGDGNINSSEGMTGGTFSGGTNGTTTAGNSTGGTTTGGTTTGGTTGSGTNGSTTGGISGSGSTTR